MIVTTIDNYKWTENNFLVLLPVTSIGRDSKKKLRGKQTNETILNSTKANCRRNLL